MYSSIAKSKMAKFENFKSLHNSYVAVYFNLQLRKSTKNVFGLVIIINTV